MHLIADGDLSSLISFAKLVPSLGGGTVLVIFSWLWYSGKIVTRRELDAAEKRADLWQNVALRSLGNTERATRTAEQSTGMIGVALKTTPPEGPQ